MSPKEQPISIFIAYARTDSDYLDKIKMYLKPILRSYNVKIWYDGEIVAGEVWEDEIKKHLHQADIILTLVSATSLASDYFYDKEISEALERHKNQRTIVIPVILKSCMWELTPLKDLQALPKDGIPISKWPDPSEAYTNIVTGIHENVHKVIDSRKAVEADVVQKRKDEGREIEKLKWSQALNANSIEAFEQYLAQYPNGEFVKNALKNLSRLKEPPSRDSADNELSKTKAKPKPVHTFSSGKLALYWLGTSVLLYLIVASFPQDYDMFSPSLGLTSLALLSGLFLFFSRGLKDNGPGFPIFIGGISYFLYRTTSYLLNLFIFGHGSKYIFTHLLYGLRLPKLEGLIVVSVIFFGIMGVLWSKWKKLTLSSQIIYWGVAGIWGFSAISSLLYYFRL